MERDDNFKKEIENLKMNPNSVNFERVKLEEKLGKSRRQCRELEEVVARLNEEKRALTNRVKLAEERRDMIFTQNLKMTNEKNNWIFELHEKIKELKNKIMESERLAEVSREKCVCLDSTIAKMKHELEDLRQIKSESDQVVEELKLANKTIEELKQDKMELVSRLKNSSTRLGKIKENYAKMLTMKIGDFKTLVNEKGKFGTSEVGLNLDSQGLCIKKENSSRTIDDFFPSNGSSNNGLSKKCARNSFKPRVREENEQNVETSPGKQSSPNPPQEPKEPLSSGIIIDIIDSDDDISPDGVSLISNKCFSDTKVVKNKACLVTTPLSSQTSKRNRTGYGQSLLAVKRKRDMFPVDVDLHEKEHQIPKPTPFGLNSSLEKFNGTSNEESEDSEDETLLDSKMIELVKNIGSKFTYETDMLQAFQQDDELCMSGVCALYRQQVSKRESKGHLNSSKSGGFSPSDSSSGCDLAKYLIDGDEELRLKRSVSEVKKHCPEVIDQCRRLANIYVGKLFAIHRSAVDPFFGKSQPQLLTRLLHR